MFRSIISKIKHWKQMITFVGTISAVVLVDKGINLLKG